MESRSTQRRGTGGGRLAPAVVALWLAVLAAGPAGADSLQEALANAYLGNPRLDAARAELRSVDETVPTALGAKRPQVDIIGRAGPEWQDTQFDQRMQRTNPRTVGVQASQPLYRGGALDAAVSQAENQVLAQRAVLHNTEQTVLLQGATAYLDVVRDQAVVELRVSNEKVLQRQLEATRDRFRVGEITRTDVSQAEQRLAGATAARIEAAGALEASRAFYARVIGKLPDRLAPPKIKLQLPKNLEEAVAIARDRNPAVVAATYREAAARRGIDRTEAGLWPSADLTASFLRTEESTQRYDHANTATVLAQVTIPLYTSGSVAAQTRQAKQLASQRRLEIGNALREAEETAVQSWQQLMTARASTEARRAEIRAAEIALEGVRQESLVGARTVLDVLDAEQELLNARVGLVRAQREDTVAGFNVLAAIGSLTAGELKLDVPLYDYQAYYQRVRDRWWGTDIGE